MNRWLKNIPLFSTCLLCESPLAAGLVLCGDCWAELPRNRNACVQCGLAMPVSRSCSCASCLLAPPPYQSCIVPYQYNAQCRELIHQFKFDGVLAAGKIFAGSLFAAILKRNMPLPEVLVPVPLHVKRLQERGYNQAVELGRLLAHGLRIPLDTVSVRRVHSTAPQSVQADIRHRKKNLLGAFQTLDPFPYSHAAIIDDVMTTGSTAAELSRCLSRAGADRIDVWVACRA